MKRFILLVFLSVCSSSPYMVFAQGHNNMPVTRVIDSLSAVLKTQKDDTNKVNALNRLSGRYKVFGNYDSALSYAKNAQALAEKIGFKKGLADALNYIGGTYLLQSNYQKALEYAFRALTINKGIGNKQGIANTVNVIGLAYYTLGNYSKALECYFKVLTMAQESKDKLTIASALCNIGIIYGEQGNYPKALEYLFKSLEMQKKAKNKDDVAIDLGNIGYSYLLQGDYPKALEYDSMAIAQAHEVGNKNVIVNLLGDIGNAYCKQQNYARALEYNFKALLIARKIGGIDNIAYLYSNIGEAYTKLKSYKQAKTFLDSALIFSEKTGDKKNIKVDYGNLAILDSATGNYKTAYSDYKEYVTYRDSLMNQGTTQMEISYEFDKKEDSIRLEEDSIKAEYEKENIIKTDEIKRKKFLNDTIIVILALAVLLALSLINKQRIKRKKDNIISEKEKAILIVEKQLMEDELLNARKALEDHTKSMGEKNELLEQFKTDIDKLKHLKSKELEEIRTEQLEHLNKTTILTEEDWGKFKELFEQVHKGFIIRLKDRLPDLTQAEVRLICLTKLSLGTKEMANILGVSSDTIKKTRHRLRKKLGLSEEEDIYDITKYI